MRHDLMTMKVEIDPMVGASPFAAAEQLAVEATCRGKVVDREGEMEGRHCHAGCLPPGVAPRNDAGA
jgi:hypothetical protein